MITFYFVLDRTYKKGTYEQVKLALISGRSVNKFLNDQETSIYIATTFKGVYLKINVGIKILPKDFDSENNKIRKSHQDYAQINLLLHDYKYRLEIELMELMLKRKDLTSSQVKELMTLTIKGKKPNRKNITFFTAFDDFFEEKKESCTSGTMEKYHSLLKTFKEFSRDVESLTFGSINNDFERKFREYSVKVKKHKNNTIVKNFRSIKVFFRYCYEKGYIDTQVYKSFKTKEDPIQVIYLKSDEVKRIEELELEPFSRLDTVRDVFIFQLYTGQRYSDIEDLKYKDIDWSDENLVFWDNFQRKGRRTKAVRIPLLSKVIGIIKKYQTEYKSSMDLVLPALSNTSQNNLIKKVCELAGINDTMTVVHYSGTKKIEKVAPKYKFVGTHCARRTFVTLCLERGMPKETIMKISGHEDDRAIKSYIHISEQFFTGEFFKAWG